MLGRAIGELLPAALAVGIGPIFVVAVMLVPHDRRSRLASGTFVAGWIVGLTVATAVVVAITDDTAKPHTADDNGVDWVMAVIGALFIAFAVKQWLGRPRRGEAATAPAWIDGLSTAAPTRAFALGLALLVANPKNLALVFAGATAITHARLDRVETVVAIAVFVAIGSVVAVVAVLAAVVVPNRVARPLAAVRDFLTANVAVILAIVLFLLGASFLRDALD